MVGPHPFIQIRVTSAKGGATGSLKKTKSIGGSENFHSRVIGKILSRIKVKEE